ncbi:MAG: Crp/Fnr family transcriptional regulator [Bacteroidetes bacterium]|nr:Crp/Fnr family transcriptional regulator [Bacteroidota bacterium]
MNKINSACALCENKNCFIQKLPSQRLSWVDAKKYTVCFPKDQNIFWENAEVNGIHFIKNGKVKVFSSGLNKKDKVVRLAGDGHIIGHRGYGAEQYPVSAATLSESTICFIDNGSLYELFMTNPVFTYTMMMFYSQELRKSEQRAKYNSQMSSKERIIAALLYAKETFGYSQTDLNAQILNVYLTRSEIASIADTTAEEVSRTLTILESEKHILKKGRNIQLLNEKKLLDLIRDYGIYDNADS